METVLASAVFSMAMQLINSVIASQGGQLTDEQLDQLAQLRRDKLDAFNKLTEAKP